MKALRTPCGFALLGVLALVSVGTWVYGIMSHDPPLAC